jgi:hypothetical protein
MAPHLTDMLPHELGCPVFLSPLEGLEDAEVLRGGSLTAQFERLAAQDQQLVMHAFEHLPQARIAAAIG